MERILTCLSNKEIVILLLLLLLMSTGIVNLTQQSKASDNNSNKIFHANARTADINTKNNIATSTKVTKAIGNDQISGNGSGDVTCRNERHVGNAEISFGGFMSNVPLYGSCEVVAVNGESDNSLNQGGSLHSGSIGADHYSLSGTEIANKICGDSSTSNNIQISTTLTGQCGQGVTIELNANDMKCNN